MYNPNYTAPLIQPPARGSDNLWAQLLPVILAARAGQAAQAKPTPGIGSFGDLAGQRSNAAGYTPAMSQNDLGSQLMRLVSGNPQTMYNGGPGKYAGGGFGMGYTGGAGPMPDGVGPWTALR